MALNASPEAEDDFFRFNAGAVATTLTLSFDLLLANDSDPDGDPLEVLSGPTPVGPTVGNLLIDTAAVGAEIGVFEPTGFGGLDTYTYTVTDGVRTDTATLQILYNFVEPPVAVDDTFVQIGTSDVITAQLIANDFSGSGAPLELVSVGPITSGLGGVIGFNLLTGVILFQPNPGAFGTSVVTYTVSDGTLTDTGSARFTVLPESAAGLAPIAVDDAYAVAQDTTLSSDSINQSVDANDLNPLGGPLTVIPFADEATPNGVVNEMLDTGEFFYTPNPGFVGTDSFTYTVTNGVQTDTGTVTITVLDEQLVNAPPEARDDLLVMPLDTTIAFNLLSNDTDPELDLLTLTNVSLPMNGTIGLFSATGEILYTPDTGFVGTDTFRYTVSDGNRASMASVTVQVVDPNADTVISIAPDDAVKKEGDGGAMTPFTFTATRSGNLLQATSVEYEVVGKEEARLDGGPEDVTENDMGGPLPTGQITFAPGETEKTITILVKGDDTAEGGNDFTVRLSNPSDGQLGAAEAAGRILNDDFNSAVNIRPLDAERHEGDQGQTTVFTFEVIRSGGSDLNKAASVRYRVDAGQSEATSSDFGGVLPTGVVQFAPGETSKVIEIAVSGDDQIEADERFTVALIEAHGTEIGSHDRAEGVIDNDDLPIASLTSVSNAVPEGTGGPANVITYVVTLSAVALETVRVALAFDDEASEITTRDLIGPGRAPDTEVVIEAGQGSGSFSLEIGPDMAPEGDNDVVYNIVRAENALIGSDDREVITILNDDFV